MSSILYKIKIWAVYKTGIWIVYYISEALNNNKRFSCCHLRKSHYSQEFSYCNKKIYLFSEPKRLVRKFVLYWVSKWFVNKKYYIYGY